MNVPKTGQFQREAQFFLDLDKFSEEYVIVAILSVTPSLRTEYYDNFLVKIVSGWHLKMALKDYIIIIINMHNVLSFYCDFQWFYKYLFIIQENLSFVSVQLYNYK